MKFIRDSELQQGTFETPCGNNEFPIFVEDENGEIVYSGKNKNIQKEIDSYKDSVLLSKIVERCCLTGEFLEAPAECFGDTRVLPKDLMDAENRKIKAQSFIDSLSDQDLNTLNEVGFDEFIKSKLETAAKKEEPVQKEVNDNE